MGRTKASATHRRQSTPRGAKTRPTTSSTASQRWAQTKLGISFQSQAASDDAPNPRARWIEVKVPTKQFAKCSYLGFRSAWTSDYRRDAVWVQICLDSSSALGEAINAFASTRPIGFHVSKKASNDAEVPTISLSDLFPDSDASWLSDITALIAHDLVTVEAHVVGTDGEPLTLLQPAPRRRSSLQPAFALSVGVAWQKYMDMCLYKPGFAWPPCELLHVQMHRTMLWVLRASRSLPGQWHFRDDDELDRLFNAFVGCSASNPNTLDDRDEEELEPPSESTCVEFVRSGISLGYDPYRACFLGLL